MVCSAEAKEKLGQASGQDPTTVTTPTVERPICTRAPTSFPRATMVLSVKELSSAAQTTAYFDAQAQPPGKKRVLYGLGQGAFRTD